MTREQRKARRDQKREDWLAGHGPCARCGSWDGLEIDHIDPATKLFTINFDKAKALVEAELVKCQVLCFDCHIAKTLAERTRLFCSRGHEWIPENLEGYGPSGDPTWRKCLLCRRIVTRERQRRYRAAARAT